MVQVICEIVNDTVLDCPIKDFVLVQLNNTFLLGTEEGVNNDQQPTALYFLKTICIIIFLLFFAGMASGLSFALFSINPVTLEIMQNSADLRDRRKAEKILKLIKNPHLLFISLTLWDAAATETLPYFLGELTSSALSIIVSVLLVVMITDILPQVLFKKHMVQWSYYFYYPVLILKILVFPVAFPLTKLLGLFVDQDDTSYYKRNELMALLEIHSQLDDTDSTGLPPLLDTEADLLIKCMDAKNRIIKDFQKPINSFLCISFDKPLSDVIIKKVIMRDASVVLVNERNTISYYVTKEAILKAFKNNIVYPKDLEKKYIELMSDKKNCFEALEYMGSNGIDVVLVCDEKHETTGIIDVDTLNAVVSPCLIEDFTKLFQKYQLF